MNIKEAIEILKRHNKWRRGAEIPMENPTIIGIAIDTVINYYENNSELIEKLNNDIIKCIKLIDK